MNEKRIVGVTALVDGASVILMALSAAILMYRSEPRELGPFWAFSAQILSASVPIAVIAAWRGAQHTRQLLNGKTGIVRPACEGFITAFAASFLVHILGAFNEAFAAGGYWDGATDWRVADWVEFLWFVTKFSAAVGAVGATLTLPISAMNRLVIRICREP